MYLVETEKPGSLDRMIKYHADIWPWGTKYVRNLPIEEGDYEKVLAQVEDMYQQYVLKSRK